VGGDAGVVAPDLVQQHVARHHALGRAIEELEDVGFLLGQADLAVAVVDKHLHRRLEL
jgi:hypothetical protein